jgi:DNA-binding ferritin-like protein
MNIPSRMRLAVVSIFKAAAEGDQRRFQNFANFLGISLKPKQESAPAPEEQTKEAAMEIDARSKPQVKNAIREAFINFLKPYMPIGYFEAGKRDTFKVRNEMFQELPDNLFNAMQHKIIEILGDKAKREGYKLNTGDIVLEDESVDSEIIKMLDYYKKNPENFEKVINFAFSPARKDTGGKRYETKPGETWFTPIVSDELYAKYKKYIADNREGLRQRAQREGKDEITTPEAMGIYKGKADPYAIRILDGLKKFNIEVKDKDIAMDTRESLPTTSILFFIPELAKARPVIYDDILFRKKLPANMGPLGRENKKHPVTVQYSSDKGLAIRFTEVYKAWEENTSQVFKILGFTDKASYQRLVQVAVRYYGQATIRNAKDLDTLISELGGKISVRDKMDPKRDTKTISTAEDLGELQEYGGEQVTKEELKSTYKPEKTIEKYKQQDKEIAEKLQKVKDMWGDKIQAYLFNISPEDGKAMREAIVRTETLPTIKDVTLRIKAGELRVGFANLINTKEVAEKTLEFIFDERTPQGENAWRVLIKNYILTQGLQSDEFVMAIKALLFRDLKKSEGKNRAALTTAMRDSSWDEITSKYSIEDVGSFLKEQNFAFVTEDLNKAIKKAISKNENSPAFKTFFSRLRTWADIAHGKTLQTKLERILEGDDPSPVTMDEALKAKIVREYKETDPRIEDELTELEEDKRHLEKEKEEQVEEDPDLNLELEETNKKINALKEKSIKKERIDLSVPEAKGYLEEVIKKLIEERLQKAYVRDFTKKASCLEFIKSTYYFLKNKEAYNGKTYL